MLTILRLLLLVALVAVGIEDARTRWIPRWVWWPMLAVAVAALAVESLTTTTLLPAVRLALSLLVCLPLAALCWVRPEVGNADAKALATLAVAFPSAPAAAPYLSPLIPFSLTILVNTLAVGAVAAVTLVAVGGRDELAARAGDVPYIALLAVGAVVGVTVGDVAVFVRSLA